MARSRLAGLLFATLGLVACRADDTSAEGGSTGDAESTGGDETTTGGDETTTGEPEEDLEFAAGLRIDRITANQGVQVTFVSDGVSIDPADYNTRMISGRFTLMRAYWTLHADFEPRELLARLTLEKADGSVEELDNLIMVEGESAEAKSSFYWFIPPETMEPGLRYRVRVYEPDPELASGEISDPPPILPLAGNGDIGVYDMPLEMKVLLVPVAHTMDECPDGIDGVKTPDVTDEDVAALKEELEQNNPVQEAILSVREPMVYTQSIAEGPGFSPVLSALAQLRAADAPDDNVYYYGLIDPCDGYPPGLLGQAIGIPDAPLKELANERISTGRWNGSGAAAAETFVHEVGHSQGRRHVTCSGGEGGPDPAYPHPGGRIGVWGFGIHDLELRSPTGGRDYMTYCSGEWVSDYAWEQTLEIIEVLTSWDNEAPVNPGNLLVGALYEDGSEEWWTAPGGIPATRLGGDASVSFEIDGASVELPAAITTRPHSDTKNVYVALPTGFDRADAIELRRGGTTPHTITPASIKRFHD